MMLVPQDRYALPSKNDIKNVLKAINEIEARLEQDPELVHTLAKELEALKAWAAPIRRLPFDILSLLFVEASEQDWEAPLALEQVCASWRACLLHTPRAWVNIELSHRFSPGVMEKYLTRSRQCPIHLHVEAVSHSYALPLSRLTSRHASRICSLEIDAATTPRRKWHVSTLKRLHIAGEASGRLLFKALVWESPTLEFLSVGQVDILPSYRNKLRQYFANLQHLVIRDAEGVDWVMIVEECASTLQVLELTFFEPSLSRVRQQLHFPLLHRLVIDSYSNQWWLWPFDAVTPKLLSYSEFHSYARRDSSILPAYHRNTESVVHLHTNRVPNFAQYPNLHCLHLSSTGMPLSYDAVRMVDAQARNSCPKFRGIFVNQSEGDVIDPKVTTESEEASSMMDTLKCALEMI